MFNKYFFHHIRDMFCVQVRRDEKRFWVFHKIGRWLFERMCADMSVSPKSSKIVPEFLKSAFLEIVSISILDSRSHVL